MSRTVVTVSDKPRVSYIATAGEWVGGTVYATRFFDSPAAVRQSAAEQFPDAAEGADYSVVRVTFERVGTEEEA